MKLRRREAFTLIELMVSLVVAGILMAALVGISGTVQRSFGRSKDIIELQANLRMAMHGLVEDISRAAFMYSPDPRNASDSRTRGIPPAEADIAVDLDPVNSVFTLRGNYVSSRDYLYNLEQKTIGCRSGQGYDCTTKCKLGGSGTDFDEPFDDGPAFGEVFCAQELVRMEIGDGRFQYFTIAGASGIDLSLSLSPKPVRSTQVRGEARWISPVTTVEYRMINDPTYPKPYLGAAPELDYWILQRISKDCRGNIIAEVADFLLPPTAATPGFYIEPYYVTPTSVAVNNVCMGEYDFTVDSIPTPVAAGAPIDPLRLRALAIILRGRTEMEDPGLTVAHFDHSVDLDGNPANGMAHVRVERTMVQMPNMGINLCVTSR